MDSSRPESFSTAWEARLRSKIKGEIVNPGNPKYDEARNGFDLMVNQRPALIILPENTQDVMETVRLAREEGFDVAVQSTVHGVACPADDCLLIRTSNMTDIRVDAASQTAWVAAGAKWGHVLPITQAHGLAPLLGSSPDVGVVGYTLGGGFGWLGRKYGLAADSVNYFELVTADGQLLRASDEENPDLFWGLRGGGSSLGIVTGMEIKLYPASTVYGGFLVYPMEKARAVLTRCP
jgi:FAD/FMN-containing dehydrogenase